jgi:transposase
VTGAQVIGIDEWAKRKGRTYGTIVVDLERHTVVDVLDQHSSVNRTGFVGGLIP